MTELARQILDRLDQIEDRLELLEKGRRTRKPVEAATPLENLETKTEALLEERRNMSGVPMPDDVKDMLGRFFDGVKTME